MAYIVTLKQDNFAPSPSTGKKEESVIRLKRLQYRKSKTDLAFDEWIRTEKNLPQSVIQIIKK